MNEGLAAAMSLVPAIPVLLVWVVGIVLALARLKTHRRSSALLAGGLFGLLVQRILLTPLYTLLPLWTQTSGVSVSSLGMIFAGIGTIESVFSALWYGLIIAAVLLPEPDPGSAP